MNNIDRIHVEAQSVAVMCLVNLGVFFSLLQGLSWTYGDHFGFVLLVGPIGFYLGLRAQHWYREWSVKGYYRKFGHER